ncbi:AsmA family protein [Paludisphaera rhizosphaerae]|uniref:AsmA family protein n=1 Tax=Paludisphaera rhizosphaerae TaxID=2711216 RepID=UPI0013E9A6B3|nr:AsmA-like C-terminal region-containing protein [Paludisphaera rhizosphaerae]
MGFWRRLVKFMLWSAIVGLTLTTAAVWFAYAFVTDGDTVARLIRAELRLFFPRAQLEFGRIDFRPLRGKATLKQVSTLQHVDGQPFETASISWMEVRFDPWRLLHGEAEPSEVVVIQPKLRIRRKKDGGWNLMDLPARPWPTAVIENPPPVEVKNGTVEMILDPESDTPTPTAILREVSVRVKPAAGGRLHFEGTAKGDLFATAVVSGSIDPATGDLDLSGGLYGLTISDTLHRRLPPEVAAAYDAMALESGVVDVDLKSLAFRPNAAPQSQLTYDVEAQIRGGVCACPSLPFPINELSARLKVHDGDVTIVHADGANGTSRFRASGTIGRGDPLSAPLKLQISATDLDLDQRLREKTPPQFDELWDVFKPVGRVDVLADVSRSGSGPVALAASVNLRGVSALYRHFKYPLKNLTGKLVLQGRRLTVDVKGPVGDKPARLMGTVDNPGPDAVVDLAVAAEALPIDAAFLDALPPDVRRQVDAFRPSGSVSGKARIRRVPLAGPPPVKPEGWLAIDADLDLDPRLCQITWAGMPYPIRDLSGRLSLHPDLWIFENLCGRNGQAVIRGSGRVERIPGPDLPNGDPPLRIAMKIDAQNLPFNTELRDALQPAWRKSWSIINPRGASNVAARITVETDKPTKDDIQVDIAPLAESSIALVIPKSPEPGVEPGATIELAMQDVLGTFKFVNGRVYMSDVRFKFHGADVEFPAGEVQVEDSGRFELSVKDLWVRNLLFSAGLRRVMPSLMAQFAIRLDDGHAFSARGNIDIGWNGEPGTPAWCRWQNTGVVLMDNKLKAGIPLEHVNGKLKDVWGWSDGRSLEVHGILDIDSVFFADLQLSQLQGPLTIKDGVAELKSLRGSLLGGVVYGNGRLSLSDAPSYAGSVQLSGAQLQEYAKSVPGRQSYRGLLNAEATFSGQGSDVRTIQGRGEAHVVDGDIGELPFVLRYLRGFNNFLRTPKTSGRTMFDSADLVFRIDSGNTHFQEIKLTGDAVSLRGTGTRDPSDKIDLTFDVAYGRNNFDVPILREATGLLGKVKVSGTLSSPQYNLVPLPVFGSFRRQ